MEKAIELLSAAPRKRFNITTDTGFSVWQLGNPEPINPEDFLSLGKSTPFASVPVEAKCLLTVYGGKAVYSAI